MGYLIGRVSSWVLATSMGAEPAVFSPGTVYLSPPSAAGSELKRLSEEMSYPFGPSWRALKAKCRRAMVPRLQ